MNIQKTSGFSAVATPSSKSADPTETQAGFASAALTASSNATLNTAQATQNKQSTATITNAPSATAADPTPKELLEKAKSGTALTDAERMILVGDAEVAYEYAKNVLKAPYDPKTTWGLKALNAIAGEPFKALDYFTHFLGAPYDPKTDWGIKAINSILTFNWNESNTCLASDYIMIITSISNKPLSKYYFSNHEVGEASDFFKAYVTDFVQAEVLRERLIITTNPDGSQHVALNPNYDPQHAVRVLDRALESLKGMSVEDFKAYSDAWHNGAALPDHLKPLNRMQWMPVLTGDYKDAATGYTITELTTSEALRAEGHPKTGLDHCVGNGGYASAAVNSEGRVHLWSVRDAAGNRVSTVEVHVVAKGTAAFRGFIHPLPSHDFDLLVVQHQAHGNSTPPSIARTTLNNLLNGIANKTVPLAIANDAERSTKLGRVDVEEKAVKITYGAGAEVYKNTIETEIFALPTAERQGEVEKHIRTRWVVVGEPQTRLLRQMPDGQWIARQSDSSWAYEYADGSKTPVPQAEADAAVKTRSVFIKPRISFLDGKGVNLVVKEGAGALNTNSKLLRVVVNAPVYQAPYDNKVATGAPELNRPWAKVDGVLDPTTTQTRPTNVLAGREKASVTVRIPDGETARVQGEELPVIREVTIQGLANDDTALLEAHLAEKGVTAAVRLDEMGRYQIYTPTPEQQASVGKALGFNATEVVNLNTPDGTQPMTEGHYDQNQLEGILNGIKATIAAAKAKADAKAETAAAAEARLKAEADKPIKDGKPAAANEPAVITAPATNSPADPVDVKTAREIGLQIIKDGYAVVKDQKTNQRFFVTTAAANASLDLIKAGIAAVEGDPEQVLDNIKNAGEGTLWTLLALYIEKLGRLGGTTAANVWNTLKTGAADIEKWAKTGSAAAKRAFSLFMIFSAFQQIKQMGDKYGYASPECIGVTAMWALRLTQPPLSGEALAGGVELLIEGLGALCGRKIDLPDSALVQLGKGALQIGTYTGQKITGQKPDEKTWKARETVLPMRKY